MCALKLATAQKNGMPIEPRFIKIVDCLRICQRKVATPLIKSTLTIFAGDLNQQVFNWTLQSKSVFVKLERK